MNDKDKYKYIYIYKTEISLLYSLSDTNFDRSSLIYNRKYLNLFRSFSQLNKKYYFFRNTRKELETFQSRFEPICNILDPISNVSLRLRERNTDKVAFEHA